MSHEQLELKKQQIESPLLYLAIIGDGGQTKIRLPSEALQPSILVSYVFLNKFMEYRDKYCFRSWMMDSGAYSAYNSGVVIDLNQYIDDCFKLIESGKGPDEIIALDVIGSGEGSLKNTIIMKERGLDIVPVFHIGEDWEILKEYLKLSDKVGLSCRFGEKVRESYAFYDKCFSIGWPKRFHSFGWIDEKMLMRYPFHSGDSNSWEIGPCGFGNWKLFGHVRGVTGSNFDLSSQVEWYLELERKLRWRWKKEMEKLNG